MLRLEDFSVCYEESEDHRVISDLTVDFAPGTVTVLTGPSGCGKTSLLQAMNGVIPAGRPGRVGGRIRLGDADLTDLDVAERSAFFCTVFQNPKTQFYALNSFDELVFGLENCALPADEIRRRVDRYAKLLGTEGLLGKNMMSLSGGQKQMIAVTSVAAMERQVYLFDEPSSALDGESIAALAQALALLKSLGKIVILAEHRLYYLAGLVDRFLIFDGQRVVDLPAGQVDESVREKYRLRSLSAVADEGPYRRQGMLQKSPFSARGLSCITGPFGYERGKTLMDLAVEFPGPVTFLTGKNGVGKSTLLRGMCGLIRGFRGVPVLKGQKLRPGWKAFSPVMQDVNYQLFTPTVWDEMALVTSDQDRIEACLARAGLSWAKERTPQSLSGGEKQRLCLARADGSDRPVVLLDEPTGGLCRGNMERVADLIDDLARRGRQVLITTHDREFMAACSGERVELVSGQGT